MGVSQLSVFGSHWKLLAGTGIALVIASANPLFFAAEHSSMPLKTSIDSLIILGGGLIGFAIFEYIYLVSGARRNLYDYILRASTLFKGVPLTWIIPSVLIAVWYSPNLLVYSLTTPIGELLEVGSMTLAGFLAGLAWGGMSKTMHSVTLFMVFFMSGSMGEILTEEGGLNVFFPTNYPFYAQSQLLYTGYMMWLISLFPVTFFAVRTLRDMKIF